MTPTETMRALEETLTRAAEIARDPIQRPEVRTLALSVALLTRIVAEQEQRIAALASCPEGGGRPHAWLDDGTCGFCRTRRST